MPFFLYGVGALTFAIGIATIGFGIQSKEFGLGNTLILAGMTAAVGGLIIIALGVVVGQLRRIAEGLGSRTPVRTSRQFETFEPAAQPQGGPARVPFPSRPKAEPKTEPKTEFKQEVRSDVEPEPRMAAPEPRMEMPFAPPPLPFKEPASDYFAPHLPNPDEPPVTVADEAHLSPLHPSPPPAFFRVLKPAARHPEPPAKPFADRDEPAGHRDEPTGHRDEHVPPPPPRSFFDTMWPAEPKAPERKAHEAAAEEPKAEESKAEEVKPAEIKGRDIKAEEPKLQERKAAAKPAELSWPEPRRSEPGFGKPQPPARPAADDAMREAATGRRQAQPAEPAEEEEPHAVAILKSGVVDGMGYTLYVDGSIEAELPQGTLRFASINELRSHLEKTS